MLNLIPSCVVQDGDLLDNSLESFLTCPSIEIKEGKHLQYNY